MLKIVKKANKPNAKKKPMKKFRMDRKVFLSWYDF